MSWTRPTLFSVSLLLSFLPGGSAGAEPAPGPPRSPCDREECRQFDFWVGDWEVDTPDGKRAGTNRIEKILGGCVLFENWSGARGMHGKSFNIWDASRRTWHQTWVDDSGTLLSLDGSFRDGRMVLEGSVPAANDSSVLHRITWEPLTDGRVRQHWTTSSDEGRTWQDAFVGLYRRRK